MKPSKIIRDLCPQRRQVLTETVLATVKSPVNLNDCEHVPIPSTFSKDFKNPDCNKNVFIITKKDFKHSPNGIIPYEPGIYKLKQNINFRPTTERAIAINIVASNITLDFESPILKQVNTVPLVYGIGAPRDVNNFKLTGIKKESQNTGIGFNVLNADPNLVLGNIAYANTGGNYQGVPASVIIEATNVNLPDTVGAKNLSITV